MHEFIKMWKDQAGREKFLQAAKERQALIGEEIERLSALDAIKAEIFGLDKNSILRG